MEFFLEKLLIAMSLLAGFPLFFLDRELFGMRRFGWLLATCSGLVSLLFMDPSAGATANDNNNTNGNNDDSDSNTELAILLDKITVAAICVTAIPHYIQLTQESFWFGMATIPPIFIVVHLSTATEEGTEAYWRLRCFLHVAVFIVPYLNHLPTFDDEKKKGSRSINTTTDTTDDKTTEETNTTDDKKNS